MPTAATIPILVYKSRLPSIAEWLDTVPNKAGSLASYLASDGTMSAISYADDPVLDQLRAKFHKAAKRKRDQRTGSILKVEIALFREEASWLARQVEPPGMFAADGRRAAIAALPYAVRDLCGACRAKVLRRRGRPKLYSDELRRTAEGTGPALSDRQLQRRRAKWRKQRAWAEATSAIALGKLYQNPPD